MAATSQQRRQEQHDEPSVRERLTETVRTTLRPHVISMERLEVVTEAMVTALWGTYIIGIRRPRARQQTLRAQMLQLPDDGVVFPYMHGDGRKFVLRVTNGRVELVSDQGEHLGRYDSLKQAAVAILGYQPGTGGWRFFFGSQTPAEVSARYGRKP